MTKEIFRVKYIRNNKIVSEFAMNFEKWRRIHRKGGGCPYVVVTSPDWTNRIEISLRSEEADSIVESLQETPSQTLEEGLVDRKMNGKIKEIQDYLEKRGIKVSETAIIEASIKIATRWGGNAVFIGEFKGRKRE